MRSRGRRTLGAAAWLAALLLGAVRAEPPAGAGSALLDRALAGTLGQTGQVVFATRMPYDDPHWYANIGYYCDDSGRKAYPGNGRPDAGRLMRLELRTGQTSLLYDAGGGSVRDPQVHYDGRRILFAARPEDDESFHLFEIGVDGAGLRQLTRGAFDDFEPCYLPDGGIAFVSTRCRRWVNCWMTQVAVLYRCDGDGGGIEPISANPEHDNTPSVLHDGRILYTRWEYVDRSQVSYHHLWTMNPDGTGQAVFYGNMRPDVVMIDAKPVPESERVLASFSPGHGVNEHAGIATLVTARGGPDDPAGTRALHDGPLVRDPYPLAEDLFLAARENQVVLMDDRGAAEVLLAWPGPGVVQEPRPVVERPRERRIPPRADPRRASGRFLLADVYRGRNMAGVARGAIKQLLVLEVLPKPVNFSGGPDLTSWLGTFSLERVLGTVPVEADGSAWFECPADRPVFFVALDAAGLSVKRMQSFAVVRPGETLGCVGCHEQRQESPPPRGGPVLAAVGRPPSRIEPFSGFPDVLDFPRDIQPVLDRHCLKCHDDRERTGGVVLHGDLGPHWSHAYFMLLARRQVGDGRNGFGNQPPRTLGSAASPLLDKVGGAHHDVRVSPREWRTLWLWLESGAPFAGSYAALRNEEQQRAAEAATGAALGAQRALLERRCLGCHAAGGRAPAFAADPQERRRALGRPTAPYERVVLEADPAVRFSPNILLNFTRPERSLLLLAPLAREAGGYGLCPGVFADRADPDYRALLAAIEQGRALLTAEPRYGEPGFRPNRQYVRELARFGVVPPGFDRERDPIDPFAADQAYWRLFWHDPDAGAAAAAGG